jgi:hypothetical protein
MLWPQLKVIGALTLLLWRYQPVWVNAQQRAVAAQRAIDHIALGVVNA